MIATEFSERTLAGEDARSPRVPHESPGRTILLIDDQTPSREALAELLGDDYEVLQSGSGGDGLAKALLHRPDLILLDVVMPGMNGYQVLGRLKADERTAGIPVIFVTGLNAPEDEARGLRQGVADYITKPINPAVVFARVGLHLRAAHEHQQLKAQATLDGLTGIANRRRFDHVLDWECRRAQRTKSPITVAMVDVDCFKQYNDLYGHAVGDQALRTVARTLDGGLRRTGDLAARYGGEEFALVLVDTADGDALHVMDTLAARIRGLEIPHEKSPYGALTISVGVAHAPGDSLLDPASLLKLADARMYRAKSQGRNRVVGA